MDFLSDTLAPGMVFLLGGVAAVPATGPDAHKGPQWVVSYFFVFFIGIPVAGLDVPVPWAVFSETCLVASVLLCIVALLRYARKELGEGEHDRGGISG
jgi:hypothetical protein